MSKPSDRELLELAAKAAGMMVEWWDERGAFVDKRAFVMWNSLTDDGDALRLAVKLKLAIHIEFDRVSVFATGGKLVVEYIYDKPATDPSTATRRAITRAAAAIGEKL